MKKTRKIKKQREKRKPNHIKRNANTPREN
jgi:hypothetical protein